MTHRAWAAGAVVVGGLGVAACAGVPLAKDTITEPGQLLFNGYANPNATCYECHNGDGDGKWPHGPNLHNEVPNATDGEIRTAILKGRSIMPAYEGKLSDAEVTTLVAWLRATYGGPTAKPANAGEAVPPPAPDAG